MGDKWKTIAIVFIVLFVSLTLLNIWLFFIGKEIIDNEKKCLIDVCEDDYIGSYDSDTNLCCCFDEDYEIVKQKYMG